MTAAGATRELNGAGGSLVGSNTISTFIGLSDRVENMSITEEYSIRMTVLTAIDKTSVVLLEGYLTVTSPSKLDICDTGGFAVLVIRELDAGDWSDSLCEQVLCTFTGRLRICKCVRIRALPEG